MTWHAANARQAILCPPNALPKWKQTATISDMKQAYAAGRHVASNSRADKHAGVQSPVRSGSPTSIAGQTPASKPSSESHTTSVRLAVASSKLLKSTTSNPVSGREAGDASTMKKILKSYAARAIWWSRTSNGKRA